jgi:hypothetical protein
MSDCGQLVAISNNKADQEYLLRGIGIKSKHIPSLCLYTNATYSPKSKRAIVYGERSFFPPCENLVERLPSGYSWSDLYSYMAIVHIPYEMSTMSLFEQYSAGIPLFLPSKQFYKSCIQNGSMPFGSVYSDSGPDSLKEPLTSIDFWLDRADYYDSDNFKFIYYYNSPEDLLEKIANFHLSEDEIAARKSWLEERKQKNYNIWKNIILKTFSTHFFGESIHFL